MGDGSAGCQSTGSGVLIMGTNTKTPEGKSGVRTVRAPRVIVEVTEAIIQQAVRRDSSHCVLAEAVKIAHPGALRVSVDLQTIRFTAKDGKYRYTYLTPRVGQVALVNFDQGILPAPFTMLLRGGAVTKAGVSAAERARRVAVKAPVRVHPPARENDLGHIRLDPSRDGTQAVPQVTGGSPPPRAALPSGGTFKGRRRAFGLKALNQ
jgi:hypothetical protein